MSSIQIERREFLGSVVALAGAIALPHPETSKPPADELWYFSKASDANDWEEPWHSELTLCFAGLTDDSWFEHGKTCRRKWR